MKQITETTPDLEDRIWKPFEELYQPHELKNFKDRLTLYFQRTPAVQALTQQGLKHLSYNRELVSAVQVVATGKFYEYLTALESDLYAGGVNSIFDSRKTLFLRDKVRTKRDGTLRYGALLHILIGDNPVVSDITRFVEDVDMLMHICNNLIDMPGKFAAKGNYDNYNEVKKEVEGLRSRIANMNGIYVKGIADHFLGYSHCVDAMVLFHFVNVLGRWSALSQDIDVTKLEQRRQEIAAAITETREYRFLGHSVKKFYSEPIDISSFQPPAKPQ